jgi:hypothetical protein
MLRAITNDKPKQLVAYRNIQTNEASTMHSLKCNTGVALMITSMKVSKCVLCDLTPLISLSVHLLYIKMKIYIICKHVSIDIKWMKTAGDKKDVYSGD